MSSMYSWQNAVLGGECGMLGFPAFDLPRSRRCSRINLSGFCMFYCPCLSFLFLLFHCRHVVEILGELSLQICFGFIVAVRRRKSCFLPMWDYWSDETSTLEMVPSHGFPGGCGKMLVLEKAPFWLARVRSWLNSLFRILFSKRFFVESSCLNWGRHKHSNAVKLIWDSFL